MCLRRALSACATLISTIVFMSTAPGGAGAQDILVSRAPNREQIILDGARKEGQVVLYSAAIVNQALRPLAEAFMKTYPFVKMTFWRGDTEEIIAKLSAEERANNIVADVVEGTGVGELAVQAGLTQPYYSPMIEAMPERYRDPRSQWTSTRLSYFSIAYNTKLVPADQVPKSYDDLLDPRWRGKLAWRVGTASGTPLFITTIRLSRGEDKAADYFHKLAAQKMINFGSGSARTLVDRVIAGEFPIAVNIFAHHPQISKAKGAPVEFPAHGSGTEFGRHDGHSERRAPSVRSAAAGGLHFVQRRAANPRQSRLLSLPLGCCAKGGAGVRDSSARPRAGAVSEPGSAQPIYRKLAKDI